MDVRILKLLRIISNLNYIHLFFIDINFFKIYYDKKNGEIILIVNKVGNCEFEIYGYENSLNYIEFLKNIMMN
jgi:hypothetical protein